jgi:predicted permease
MTPAVFLGDLRLAWRNAMRRPAFTLLVAATLALGLGVNSAVFALLDSVLLRPLPYRNAARLVFVWQTLPRLGVAEVEATPFDYDAWHALRTVSDIAMIQYGSYTLSGTGNPANPDDAIRLRGSRVTASLIPMLGIAPTVGRAFLPAEDFDDGPAVVILSNGLWRRRFGADPGIVGRVIQVDGEPRMVVGVMPRGATLPGALPGPESVELWLPARLSPSDRVNEVSHNDTIIARLADGATLAQASAELDAFAARLAAERASHKDIGARLVPIREQTVRSIRPALVVAAASVALLLLIATANASTLLIARASNRRHELAVRAALGATRARLLSLSVAESLVYAGIGGLAALALGSWALRALIPLFAASLPGSVPVDAVKIDERAALVTAALSVAIGILFGAVAAPRLDRRLAGSLGASTRSSASSSAGRTRSALVIAQIALAVVLLSATGLMLTSVVKLARVSPGFDPDHVLSFNVTLTGPRYAAAPARVGFVSDLVERLAAVGGVQSAGVTSLIPFGGMRGATGIEIEGRTALRGAPGVDTSAGEAPAIIDQRHVSPGYFQTMRIPIVSGRGLSAADDRRGERVTVINRAMARRYFPNEDPVNRRVRATVGFDSGIWFRIVGVAEDVRHISLSRDPVPEMYHPIAQTAVPAFTVVVRTAGNPAALAPAARAAVQAADASLPIYDVETMNDRIASSFATTRGTMLLLLVTAALAAALSAVAIYGSIWYAVNQRVPEIGIRMALGASRGSVFRRVVVSAVTLAAFGAMLGGATAMAAGSLLRTLLFDTRPTDPLTYVIVVAGVLALAAAAGVVPAVRAMRVDPITALRNE